MKPIRQTQLVVIANAVLLLGGIACIALIQYPSLHSLRSSIDRTRASIAAIAIQQRNLEDLQRQQTALTDAHTALQKEVWSFQTEDEFYSSIQSVATSTQTVIAEPKLADAVPTTSYQLRTGTISMSGSTANIMKAIQAVTELQPLVAIQQIILSNSGSATVASLTIQTTWQ